MNNFFKKNIFLNLLAYCSLFFPLLQIILISNKKITHFAFERLSKLSLNDSFFLILSVFSFVVLLCFWRLFYKKRIFDSVNKVLQKNILFLLINTTFFGFYLFVFMQKQSDTFDIVLDVCVLIVVLLNIYFLFDYKKNTLTFFQTQKSLLIFNKLLHLSLWGLFLMYLICSMVISFFFEEWYWCLLVNSLFIYYVLRQFIVIKKLIQLIFVSSFLVVSLISFFLITNVYFKNNFGFLIFFQTLYLLESLNLKKSRNIQNITFFASVFFIYLYYFNTLVATYYLFVGAVVLITVVFNSNYWLSVFLRLRKKLFNKKILSVLLILLLGFSLRITSLNYDYPIMEVGEENHTLRNALKIVQDNKLTVGYYNHPKHIDIFMNSFFFKFLGTFVDYLPNDLTIDGMPLTYINGDLEKSYDYLFTLLMRFICLLVIILAILFIFLIGNQFHFIIGLLMSLLASIYPYSIYYAFQKDMSVVFWILIALFFSLKFLKSHQRSDLIFSVFFVAAAFLSKYPAVLVSLVVGYAVLTDCLKEPDKIKGVTLFFKQSIKMPLLFFSFVFLLSPNILLKIDRVYKRILLENRTYHPGMDGYSFSDKMSMYLDIIVRNTGFLLLVCCVLGLLSFILSRKKIRYLPILLFPLLYLIFISKLSLFNKHWILPVLPLIFFFGAFGIGMIFDKIKSIHHSFIRKILLSLTLGMLLISLLNISFKNLHYILEKRMPSTRLKSLEYLKNNNIEKEQTAYQSYTGFAPSGDFRKDFFFQYKKESYQTKKYFLISTGFYQRYYDDFERFSDSDQISIMEEIFNLEEVIRFVPHYNPHNPKYIFEINNLALAKNYLTYYWKEKKSLAKGDTIHIFKK